MKPLSELSLNKYSLLNSTESKEKIKSKRPALEMLNMLNNKLVEENHVAQYKKEMERLQEQNSELKAVNG